MAATWVGQAAFGMVTWRVGTVAEPYRTFLRQRRGCAAEEKLTHYSLLLHLSAWRTMR